MSLVYAMPMPSCSSCGRQMRHLYEDHINLTRKLERDLQDNTVQYETYKGQISKIDITEFVHTYYNWSQKHPEAPTFKPHNIIARGLLSLKPLTEEMLPFGMDREEDNQLSILAESLCCLRMLQCNPSLSI